MDAKIALEPVEQSVLHFAKRECVLTDQVLRIGRDASATGSEVRADNLIFDRILWQVSVNHAQIWFEDCIVSYIMLCIL